MADMEDFDPAKLFEPGATIGGTRKHCTDGKRCGMGMSCEHAQVRDESVELISLWVPDGADNAACANWEPRRELCSEGDLFRNRKRHKHNQLRRSNIVRPKAPDLMVSRHIRDGRNIKGDD
jgi:hypothetical protein